MNSKSAHQEVYVKRTRIDGLTLSLTATVMWDARDGLDATLEQINVTSAEVLEGPEIADLDDWLAHHECAVNEAVEEAFQKGD